MNHATDDCPHGFFSSKCRKCGSVEHATDDCPHGLFSAKCRRCGSLDHATDDCPQGFFASPKSDRAIHSDDGNDSAWGELIGKIVIGLFLIGFVIWLISVEILLAILNISLICLVSAYFYPRFRTIILSTGMAGTVFNFVIYNTGWTPKLYLTDLSMIAALQPYILYGGLAAGLVASYFVLTNIVNAKFADESSNPKYLSNNEKLVLLALLLVGGMVFGLQQYVDAHRGTDGGAMLADASPVTGITSEHTLAASNGGEIQMFVSTDANVRDRATARGSAIIGKIARSTAISGAMQTGEDGTTAWFRLANGAGFVGAVNLSVTEPPALSAVMTGNSWLAPAGTRLLAAPNNSSQIVEILDAPTHLEVSEPDPKVVERYQYVVIHAVFAKRWSGSWHGLISPDVSIAGRVFDIHRI